MPDKDASHVPAAFINAIAEEGTKAEAVEWLQKLWNENCALREECAKAAETFDYDIPLNRRERLLAKNIASAIRALALPSAERDSGAKS